MCIKADIRFRTRQLILTLFLFFIVTGLQAQDTEQINLANEYYRSGELEKAKDIYQKLARNTLNIPLIHNNYFELLLSTSDFEEAIRYIDKRIKDSPGNSLYLVDKGIVYKRSGNRQAESEYFKKLIRDLSADEYQTRLIAQYFIKNQMLDYAVEMYLAGRNNRNEFDLYALELANIYRMVNKKDLMVDEYLNFVIRSSNNLNYVKNVLQIYLEEKIDLENFEAKLIERTQKDPDNRIYGELLIWVNIQLKNFYGAFIQARAYDRKFDKDGSKLLEVGFISLENKAYNDAILVFDYLASSYKDSYLYPIAKRYKIKSREDLVKNTYPVDLQEIRKLAGDYQQLTYELGVSPAVAEAMLSKAQLHAFYLDEIDSAIKILNEIVLIPKISPDLAAKCKLELGDIYILAGESWESMLLYAQVEKSRKETPIGYDAKLRSAKLSFYKGDFLLAQEHLDVLKRATTREIANDAMRLSLIIKDNTALDTSDFLLRKYASIELMLFQNKKREALDSLKYMLSAYKNSSLSDDILYLMADIYVEMGAFQEALASLEELLENFSEDILGEDALFQIGQIYEFHIRDTEKAKETYLEFLNKYPGSIYSSDARKRYRFLRGDIIN